MIFTVKDSGEEVDFDDIETAIETLARLPTIGLVYRGELVSRRSGKTFNLMARKVYNSDLNLWIYNDFGNSNSPWVQIPKVRNNIGVLRMAIMGMEWEGETYEVSGKPLDMFQHFIDNAGKFPWRIHGYTLHATTPEDKMMIEMSL